MITSRAAGGWEPSASLTSPAAFSSIGVCLVFESAVGLKPPFAVSSRLPTFTVTGVSPPAARAEPATTIAQTRHGGREDRGGTSVGLLQKSLHISLLVGGSACGDGVEFPAALPPERRP